MRVYGVSVRWGPSVFQSLRPQIAGWRRAGLHRLAGPVETVAQLEAAELARRTVAERFSDAIARMAGTAWVRGPSRRVVRDVDRLQHQARSRQTARDPFPFTVLTLVVSLGKAFLTLFVLISQTTWPAERAPSTPASGGEPAGRAGIDEDHGGVGADRPAAQRSPAGPSVRGSWRPRTPDCLQRGQRSGAFPGIGLAVYGRVSSTTEGGRSWRASSNR